MDKLHSIITNKLEHNLKKSSSDGENAINFNFISFCGHGCINDKNESLFIVPNSYYNKDYDDSLSTTKGGASTMKKNFNSTRYKFINIDEYAQRFACIANTITIFLVSACRN